MYLIQDLKIYCQSQNKIYSGVYFNEKSFLIRFHGDTLQCILGPFLNRFMYRQQLSGDRNYDSTLKFILLQT